jgi:predicted Rossmann fold nucleotide-binding protein DprA/Smf involved in DNA uptake
MYGVDVTAQQQAVQSGGETIGVLGYGFNHIYPQTHRPIMRDMLQTGQATFISEYPPWVEPSRGTFPQRNRLIAGMSLAVLVTEAGAKSGTQITVGYALDYGRDVFAVPGPITSQYSEGVKKMLNQGARLVSSGQELLHNLSAQNWDLDGIDCLLEQQGVGQAGGQPPQPPSAQAQPDQPSTQSQPAQAQPGQLLTQPQPPSAQQGQICAAQEAAVQSPSAQQGQVHAAQEAAAQSHSGQPHSDPKQKSPPVLASCSQASQQVYQQLKQQMLSANQLSNQLRLSPGQVNAALVELEVSGLATEKAGQWFACEQDCI